MSNNFFIGPVSFEIDPPSPIILADSRISKKVRLKAVSPTDETKFDFVWIITKDDKPIGASLDNKHIIDWDADIGTYKIMLTVRPKKQPQYSASYEQTVEVAEELPGVKITINPSSMKVGNTTQLEASFSDNNTSFNGDDKYEWSVTPNAGTFSSNNSQDSSKTIWDSDNALPGNYTFKVKVTGTTSSGDLVIGTGQATLTLQPRDIARGDVVPVTLQRSRAVPTHDLPLWVVIKKSTDAIAFTNYARFMDIVLCGQPLRDGENGNIKNGRDQFDQLKIKRFLPFTDVEAYRLLKAATEAFIMVNCGVDLHNFTFTDLDVNEIISRVGINLDTAQLRNFWLDYLRDVNGEADATLPYLALIREKLKESQLKDTLMLDDSNLQIPRECFGIIRQKLTHPCLLELIWSYWHEEGMLVQTLNAAALRFQNIRLNTAGRDPLAHLEIDPLRPLNNLFWGYIQDEQHRLSVARRAYEYDHHYGMNLYGKALANFRPADSRSKFLEAYHNLLHLAAIFYKEDDDTTMIADGFPLLNALKEVNLVISEGAHNQYGDLPSTARVEMLMQEWLLARPEFREFLPTRIMVAFPEAWMDRVDAMKKIQGWSDTSVLHFSNLGKFGEQIILSIRYGSWNEVNNPVQAANWARFWRSEIQGYVHAYRAATGVDLTSEITDTREASQRYLPPSVLLRNRLERKTKFQTR